MARLFGTDGIRARAGDFPLDPPSVFALGRGLAGLLAARGLKPRVLLGRDTRESGTWMEAALAGGVAAGGGACRSAGVIPTSAVSFLTRRDGYSAGVVLSASHNPFEDNGIKIFAPTGLKVSDDWEDALERSIREAPAGEAVPPRTAEPEPAGDLLEHYVDFLRSRFLATISGRNGARLKVVLDCANGAASAIAPSVYRALGFEVSVLHDAPTGRNINAGCGSLHPQSLARAVVAAGADLGIAFDGDADRALWADATGRVLTGDHTLYVQARHLRAAGRLRGATVVATIMSNMGLERALAREGVRLVRTRVGDRFVLEEMLSSGAVLGGERSGHTIFLDDLSTGDGILTSLKMAEAMLATDRSLADLASGYEEYPQVLVNVRVREKTHFDDVPEVARAAADVREALGTRGRLELRYSGTEPLARIMIEAPDAAEAEALAGRLAAVVRDKLGEA